MTALIPETGIGHGGRYRLEDRVGAGSGWATWKALDETLARPVTVLTFEPGFPRIADVVTAAQAASRLTDARLARIFDADSDPDHAYVVTEWAGGDSLDDLLAGGPLDPWRAGEIIAQSAEVLAVAHAAGVAHLCLAPGCLRWTPSGGVKITGLGIDAALGGVRAEDPAAADTRSLGRLLYAALTARWPGGDLPGLPRAPEVDGHPLSPRQVRAGVPAGLDDVCCRILLPGTAHGPPPATPAALAVLLNQVVTVPAAPALAPSAGGASFGSPRRGGRPAADGRQPVATRVMASIAAVLAVTAMGVGVWTLDHHGAAQARQHAPARPPPATEPVRVLAPVAAHGFDALSSAAEDPGDENTSQAGFAIDASPATAWHTQYYVGNPRFGGLKSGTGLILDMGKPVAISSVTVTMGPVPGANVRIEVGNSDRRAPATLRSFTTVARKRDASGTVVFPARAAAESRFVLIWFTRLPPQTFGSTGLFEAEIFNVTVRGSD
jgi:hypothetical protein